MPYSQQCTVARAGPPAAPPAAASTILVALLPGRARGRHGFLPEPHPRRVPVDPCGAPAQQPQPHAQPVARGAAQCCASATGRCAAAASPRNGALRACSGAAARRVQREQSSLLAHCWGCGACLILGPDARLRHADRLVRRFPVRVRCVPAFLLRAGVRRRAHARSFTLFLDVLAAVGHRSQNYKARALTARPPHPTAPAGTGSNDVANALCAPWPKRPP